MMQTPWMNPSPRLRRHAARLALLVACVGVVATSPPMSPPVFAEHEAEPLTLLTTGAKARRLLRLEIFSTKPSSHAIDVDVTAHLTARWRPADATQTVKPWFRARLSVGSNSFGGEGSVVLGEPGQPVEVQAHDSSFECNLSSVCTLDVLLELELQSNAAEGAVDVDWRAVAEASVEGTDELPEGFTVRFVEPGFP